MDTNITSSLPYGLQLASHQEVASAWCPITQSLPVTVIGAGSGSVVDLAVPKTEKVLTGRAKGWANLRPAKKGEIRNPKGKSGPMIKPVINKKLQDKARVEAIAETIIAGAEKGEDKKIDTLLKLTGDFTEVPTVAVQQNNNTIITPDAIKSMEEFLRTKGIDI